MDTIFVSVDHHKLPILGSGRKKCEPGFWKKGWSDVARGGRMNVCGETQASKCSSAFSTLEVLVETLPMCDRKERPFE